MPTQGTPQFWSIFARLAGTEPYRGKSVALAERLAWKIETLEELRRRGVWMLDASVHGIYIAAGQRLPSHINRRLHEIWLREYGQAVIGRSPHARRFAIGKGVHDTLRGLGLWLDGFIYQPQAARGRVDMEHDWPKLLACVGAAG